MLTYVCIVSAFLAVTHATFAHYTLGHHIHGHHGLNIDTQVQIPQVLNHPQLHRIKCIEPGFFAHTHNCRLFYECKISVHGRLKRVLRSCHHGLVFSNYGGGCTYPQESGRVECGGSLIKQPSEFEPSPGNVLPNVNKPQCPHGQHQVPGLDCLPQSTDYPIIPVNQLPKVPHTPQEPVDSNNGGIIIYPNEWDVTKHEFQKETEEHNENSSDEQTIEGSEIDLSSDEQSNQWSVDHGHDEQQHESNKKKHVKHGHHASKHDDHEQSISVGHHSSHKHKSHSASNSRDDDIAVVISDHNHNSGSVNITFVPNTGTSVQTSNEEKVHKKPGIITIPNVPVIEYPQKPCLICHEHKSNEHGSNNRDEGITVVINDHSHSSGSINVTFVPNTGSSAQTTNEEKVHKRPDIIPAPTAPVIVYPQKPCLTCHEHNSHKDTSNSREDGKIVVINEHSHSSASANATFVSNTGTSIHTSNGEIVHNVPSVTPAPTAPVIVYPQKPCLTCHEHNSHKDTSNSREDGKIVVINEHSHSSASANATFVSNTGTSIHTSNGEIVHNVPSVTPAPTAPVIVYPQKPCLTCHEHNSHKDTSNSREDGKIVVINEHSHSSASANATFVSSTGTSIHTSNGEIVHNVPSVTPAPIVPVIVYPKKPCSTCHEHNGHKDTSNSREDGKIVVINEHSHSSASADATFVSNTGTSIHTSNGEIVHNVPSVTPAPIVPVIVYPKKPCSTCHEHNGHKDTSNSREDGKIVVINEHSHSSATADATFVSNTGTSIHTSNGEIVHNVPNVTPAPIAPVIVYPQQPCLTCHKHNGHKDTSNSRDDGKIVVINEHSHSSATADATFVSNTGTSIHTSNGEIVHNVPNVTPAPIVPVIVYPQQPCSTCHEHNGQKDTSNSRDDGKIVVINEHSHSSASADATFVSNTGTSIHTSNGEIVHNVPNVTPAPIAPVIVYPQQPCLTCHKHNGHKDTSNSRDDGKIVVINEHSHSSASTNATFVSNTETSIHTSNGEIVHNVPNVTPAPIVPVIVHPQQPCLTCHEHNSHKDTSNSLNHGKIVVINEHSHSSASTNTKFVSHTGTSTHISNSEKVHNIPYVTPSSNAPVIDYPQKPCSICDEHKSHQDTSNSLNDGKMIDVPIKMDCPIGNLNGEQISLICPTGFRRHPKYCNLFYQCTSTSNLETNLAVFACPEGRVFDERETQCVSAQNVFVQSCNKYYNVGDKSTSIIKVPSTKLCYGEGLYPYNMGCSNAYYMCKRGAYGYLEGYLYKCDQGYVYSPISRRCEPVELYPNCALSVQFESNIQGPLMKLPNGLYIGQQKVYYIGPHPV